MTTTSNAHTNTNTGASANANAGGNAVLWHIDAGIGTITLNAPEQANTIGYDGAVELAEAIHQVTAAPVRAVLIHANGERFCAGGNIAEFVEKRDNLKGLVDAILDLLHPAIHKLAELPVPVVSAVNGPLGGAGISLALCADIVLAADTMKLRGGYTGIGLSPDLGASYYLAQRVGAARAKRILFMNESLPARRCLELGIVDEVMPAKDLPSNALQMVRTLSQAATQSLAGVKLLCNGAASRSLREQLDLERRLLLAAAHSRDGQEGIQAFMEKRAPVFTGS